MDFDDGKNTELWALTAADHALVLKKNRTHRLLFALLLLFHRVHGRFPKQPTEIDPSVVANIAR